MNETTNYVEKWITLVPQAEKIDHDAAANIIKQLYHFLNLPEPPIFFSSQPNQALNIFLHHKLIETREYSCDVKTDSQLSRKQEVKLKHQLGLDLSRTFTEEILLKISAVVREQIGGDLESKLWVNVENIVRKRTTPSYPNLLRNCVNCREWICYAAKFDLCINELGVDCNPQLWSIFQNLVIKCDWFAPFTKVCLIGDCEIDKFQ